MKDDEGSAQADLRHLSQQQGTCTTKARHQHLAILFQQQQHQQQQLKNQIIENESKNDTENRSTSAFSDISVSSDVDSGTRTTNNKNDNNNVNGPIGNINNNNWRKRNSVDPIKQMSSRGGDKRRFSDVAMEKRLAELTRENLLLKSRLDQQQQSSVIRVASSGKTVSAADDRALLLNLSNNADGDGEASSFTPILFGAANSTSWSDTCPLTSIKDLNLPALLAKCGNANGGGETSRSQGQSTLELPKTANDTLSSTSRETKACTNCASKRFPSNRLLNGQEHCADCGRLTSGAVVPVVNGKPDSGLKITDITDPVLPLQHGNSFDAVSVAAAAMAQRILSASGQPPSFPYGVDLTPFCVSAAPPPNLLNGWLLAAAATAANIGSDTSAAATEYWDHTSLLQQLAGLSGIASSTCSDDALAHYSAAAPLSEYSTAFLPTRAHPTVGHLPLTDAMAKELVTSATAHPSAFHRFTSHEAEISSTVDHHGELLRVPRLPVISSTGITQDGQFPLHAVILSAGSCLPDSSTSALDGNGSSGAESGQYYQSRPTVLSHTTAASVIPAPTTANNASTMLMNRFVLAATTTTNTATSSSATNVPLSVLTSSSSDSVSGGYSDVTRRTVLEMARPNGSVPINLTNSVGMRHNSGERVHGTTMVGASVSQLSKHNQNETHPTARLTVIGGAPPTLDYQRNAQYPSTTVDLNNNNGSSDNKNLPNGANGSARLNTNHSLLGTLLSATRRSPSVPESRTELQSGLGSQAASRQSSIIANDTARSHVTSHVSNDTHHQQRESSVKRRVQVDGEASVDNCNVSPTSSASKFSNLAMNLSSSIGSHSSSSVGCCSRSLSSSCVADSSSHSVSSATKSDSEHSMVSPQSVDSMRFSDGKSSFANVSATNTNTTVLPTSKCSSYFEKRTEETADVDVLLTEDNDDDEEMRLQLRMHADGTSTHADLERYMDRRRRNNEAAKRCRANRRAVFEYRSRRAQLLEAENGELRQEMLKLHNELERLKAIIGGAAS